MGHGVTEADDALASVDLFRCGCGGGVEGRWDPHRGGVFGSQPKRSHWGLVWANKMRRVLDFDQGDGGGVWYSVVESLGGGK
jgi:hypothetical protein